MGSRTLVESYDLSYSPATVRSELAWLEEHGYLMKPHTSAGRIPSDLAYRYFVDNYILAQNKQKLNNKRILDERIFAHESLEETLSRVAQVLSDYTRCVSAVYRPEAPVCILKKLELISLSSHQILLVSVVNEDEVQNRMIDLHFEMSAEEIKQLSYTLDLVLRDTNLNKVASLAEKIAPSSAKSEETLSKVLSALADIAQETSEQTVYTGGLSALFEYPEFQDLQQARPLLELFERGMSLIDLIEIEDKDIIVSIGAENPRSEFGHMSIVASPFIGPGGKGFVSAIGPTRMNYSRTIYAVSSVADELSDQSQEKKE